MFDVHNHLLPSVDDGSSNEKQSLEIIKQCINQGVTEFIFTPHFRKDEFEPSVDFLKTTYNKFLEIINDNFKGIKTHLWEEVFCDGNIYNHLKNGKIITLTSNKYVLLEFNYTAYTDIADYVYNLKSLGYNPVIAHVERYEYIKDESAVYELKQNGALIQVNASSLVDRNFKAERKKVLKLIKKGLVDFIASDAHYGRDVHLKQAYDFVCKKFSTKIADDLFTNNARKYFNN